MKRLGFLACVAVLCASSSTFAATVAATWGFEMDQAPANLGAGVWGGAGGSSVRSDGSMATGGTQTANGTRIYDWGTAYSMSPIANPGGDAAAAGQYNSNTQTGTPYSPLGFTPTYTVEARVKVSEYWAPATISVAFGWENNSLGTLHNNVYMGQRTAPTITSPATLQPGAQYDITYFESNSPAPNAEFRMARIPGQGSVSGFDEIDRPDNAEGFVTLRAVSKGTGLTPVGPTGTVDYYVDFEDGNGWQHATTMSGSGAYSDTRSRGLIFKKSADVLLEIDYIRGVSQALTLSDTLAPVPEPSSALLFSLAAGLLALARRRRR